MEFAVSVRLLRCYRLAACPGSASAIKLASTSVIFRRLCAGMAPTILRIWPDGKPLGYRASLDPDLIIRYSSRQRPGQSEDIPEVRLLAPLPSGLLFSTLTRDVTNADDLIQSSAMGLLTLTAFLRTVAVGEGPE